MENIKKEDSLEEYQKKVAHNRRIKAQVQAIMSRAKNAGIPEKFMRVNQKGFESLLDPSYHKDVHKLSTYIYKHPLELMKKEFIVIDGGGVVERKRAGFAILFRLISCDKYGTYKNGGELAHQLQSIRSFDQGEGRNDITQALRMVDNLFLAECTHGDFRNNFETGRFFDEILTYRDDHTKPTIISFTNPLPVGNGAVNSENEMTDTDRFGQYMCSISRSHKNNDKRFFKIRIKTDG